MWRVAVQVQDVGTYLCWETFVDDPESKLRLANLVHTAKDPTVTPTPNLALIPTPERKTGVGFDVKAMWADSSHRRKPSQPEGIGLGFNKIPVDVPDGYRIDPTPGQVVKLECLSARGKGDFGSYLYLAKYIGGNDIDVILAWGDNGLVWSNTVNLALHGTIALVPTDGRLKEISDANKEILKEAADTAKAAEAKAHEEAFYAAAQERIELASNLKKRKFEDLREEERTIIYRALIGDLMAKPSGSEVGWYDMDKQQYRTHRDMCMPLCSTRSSMWTACFTSWRPIGGIRESIIPASRLGETTSTPSAPIRPSLGPTRSHARTITSSRASRNRHDWAARSAGCCNWTATTCATAS